MPHHGGCQALGCALLWGHVPPGVGQQMLIGVGWLRCPHPRPSPVLQQGTRTLLTSSKPKPAVPELWLVLKGLRCCSLPHIGPQTPEPALFCPGPRQPGGFPQMGQARPPQTQPKFLRWTRPISPPAPVQQDGEGKKCLCSQRYCSAGCRTASLI